MLRILLLLYVFLMLCMFRSVYSVSSCCSVYCFCVMCTVLLPPGVNPIAVNKYIIYRIILHAPRHVVYISRGFYTAETPQPPEDCVLRNRSNGGLEVQCVAGFDGDLPQHFMLEISESPVYPDTTPPTQKHGSQVTLNDQGTRHPIPGPPLYRVFGAEPVFALSTLEPGRDYELAVYAVNAKGRSIPPVIIPRVRVSASMERLTKTGNDYVLFGAECIK